MMSQSVNLMDPVVRANPYPVYAELRKSSPVCQVEPGGMWAVSRYEDVQFVLRTHEKFSSHGFAALLRPPWLEHNPLVNSMICLDPPAHTRLRNLVSRAFGGRSIARLEPRIQAIAEELANGLQDKGEHDFVVGFSEPLTIRVICEMLGMDASFYPEFKHWTDDFAAISPAPPTEAFATSVRKTILDFETYCRDLIKARRSQPRDDITSDLLAANIDGQQLTDAEIISFLFLLLPTGNETVTNFLGNIMLAFTHQPEDVELLRNTPALRSKYIDEMLRYDPPVHTVPRFTADDVELRGVKIPRGSLVATLIASANRDETQFPDPDRFDLERSSEGGIAFGHGPHFCIGYALAKLEAQVALDTLLARFRGFERTSQEVEWVQALTVRGPKALPIRCIAA